MFQIASITPKTNLILPAIAGFSDVGMRMLCLRYGAGLTFTEMVSAKGLIYGSENTAALLATHKTEEIKGVQLFGREPDILARAVRLPLLNPFDIIDINCGCPMPKIIKNGEGSALMREPSLIQSIVEAVKKAADGRAVTVKMRAGFAKNARNAVDAARAAEAGGADMITVHGRTADMLYGGRSDREIIARVKEAVSVPVVANGDVCTREDYLSILKEMGADGVAVARAAVGRPWVFAQMLGETVLPNPLRVAAEHAKALAEILPERVAVANMKKHVAAYLKGVPGGKERKVQVYAVTELKQLLELLEEKA